MAKYEKAITDTCNDRMTVAGWSDDGVDHVHPRVYLTPEEGVEDFAFTPDAARVLAKALKRAANVAEGKPAKTKKKPRKVVDADDDTWFLSSNGFYSMDEDNPTATVTLAYIVENYGPLQ